MATVTGYVERIKYRNEDNGYSVLSVADGGEEYILVGTFPYISEGERIEATGRMVEHSIYGEQLAVESYEIKAPEDTLAIERYLGSGFCSVGASKASAACTGWLAASSANSPPIRLFSSFFPSSGSGIPFTSRKIFINSLPVIVSFSIRNAAI